MEQRFGRPVLGRDDYIGVKCAGCKALYVDTDVTDADLRELYAEETEESVKEVLAAMTHGDIVSMRVTEFARTWRTVKRFRPPKGSELLLDIGCQTGEFGSIVRRDNVQVSGIELSPEYAETARAAWGDECIVHTSGLDDAPFHDGEFQYITAFETLEHMSDPIGALRRAHRWLDSDGVLAITVPSAQYFRLKVFVLGQSRCARFLRTLSGGRFPASGRGLIPHTHVYTFSSASVRTALRRSGFRIRFMGVTGWHGAVGPAMNAVASATARLTAQRILFAPSILAIAVPIHPAREFRADLRPNADPESPAT